MEVTPAAVGGLSGAYGLALVQNFGSNTSLGADSAARRQHFQQVTFSFGERTVQDLRFTITDIDRSAEDRRQFWDQIELAPLPTTLTPAGGVVGTGASSDPLRNQTAADHDFYASPDGNVTVDYGATPISSLVVTYWNDMAGVLVESGRQLITISDLSFTLVSEGC